MPDIREFNLDELEDWIIDLWENVKEQGVDLGDLDSNSADRIELEEVVIGGEWGRGTPRQSDQPIQTFLFVETDLNVSPTESSLYQEFVDYMEPEMNNPSVRQGLGIPELPSPDNANVDGIEFQIFPSRNKEENINLEFTTLREDDPNRLYSLTRRENIYVDEELGIVRGTPDEEIEEEEGEELSGQAERILGQGVSIFSIEDLDVLRASIEEIFREVVSEVSNQFDGDLNYDIVNIYIQGELAKGEAEYGMDPLEFIIVAEDNSSVFGRAAREAVGEVEQEFNRIYNLPPSIEEVARGFEAEFFREENFTNLKGLVNNNRVVYGLIDNILYTVQEEEGRQVLQETPATEEITRTTDIPEEEPEPEPEEEPQPELPPAEEEPEEEEDEVFEFDEVPPEFQDFAISNEELEIPINKDTKRVESREPYTFERRLAFDDTGEVEFDPENLIVGSIGWAKRKGVFGQATKVDENDEGEPVMLQLSPGVFPRTGLYIREHLANRGPSFGLELHRDFVTYSAYISSIYEGDFKVGSYQSMREYLFRLKELYEEDVINQQLVEVLSQQQAAARGLDVIPELPSGQEAPWLENRVYYDLAEEAYDHPAWANPTAFLYPELEE